MPCSAGRELKQMLANAIVEYAAANEAMDDDTIPQQLRERRSTTPKEPHLDLRTLLEHIERCTACRERESALRPAYKETVLNPKLK